jgi:hypothetical protein
MFPETYNSAVKFSGSGLAVVTLWLVLPMGAAGQSTPVPRPFPGSGSQASPARPTTEAAQPLPPSEPAPASAAIGGAPVYPAAEFLQSFDAGSGQRYYLYGTNTSFAEIVQYYKNTLKAGGRELYKTPAMQQFDLGRFQDNAMAYPPSIVVKDYSGNGSAGYLFVDGTREKRFKTIIQVVPPGANR